MADNKQPAEKQAEEKQAEEKAPETKKPLIAKKVPESTAVCALCKREFKYTYVVNVDIADNSDSVCTPCLNVAQLWSYQVLQNPTASEKDTALAKQLKTLCFDRPIHIAD